MNGPTTTQSSPVVVSSLDVDDAVPSGVAAVVPPHSPDTVLSSSRSRKRQNTSIPNSCPNHDHEDSTVTVTPGDGVTSNGTPQRVVTRSKMRQSVQSFIKQENIQQGDIQCPVCYQIICVADKGCNIVTCRNHQPQYVYFCVHCKKVTNTEYVNCTCPKRNTRVTRGQAQKERNRLAKESPIEIDVFSSSDDDDDDDNNEDDDNVKEYGKHNEQANSKDIQQKKQNNKYEDQVTFVPRRRESQQPKPPQKQPPRQQQHNNKEEADNIDQQPTTTVQDFNASFPPTCPTTKSTAMPVKMDNLLYTPMFDRLIRNPQQQFQGEKLEKQETKSSTTTTGLSWIDILERRIRERQKKQKWRARKKARNRVEEKKEKKRMANARCKRLQIKRQIRNIEKHNFYRAIQYHMNHPSWPAVPPDIRFFRDSKKAKIILGDESKRRAIYQKKMKLKKRRYVPDHLYNEIQGRFFILEPKDKVTTIQVRKYQENGKFLKWSYIRFSKVSLDDTMTNKLNNNIQATLKLSQSGSGSPVGSRYPIYKTTKIVDKQLLKGLQNFKNGPAPLDYIVGSCNLAIWHKKDPTKKCTNWYLLFPDVKVNIGTHFKNGLAIKLCHGTMVEWDGMELRHYTSITRVDEGNAAFTTFFGARDGGNKLKRMNAEERKK